MKLKYGLDSAGFDYLAIEILEMLESKIGINYATDKALRLHEQNRFQILVWCNNLDAEMREELALRMGVLSDDFEITLKTLRSF